MSKRSVLVSAMLHTVALTAYFVPNAPHTGRATTVVPVDIVTVSQLSVAVLLQRDHPASPVTEPLAEVVPPKWNIGASPAFEEVTVEEAPPESEKEPEPPAPRKSAQELKPEQEPAAISPLDDAAAESDEVELTLPETVAIKREGPKLRLDMLGDVLFELNSHELRPDARALIASIAPELGRHAFTFIDVKGFTDTSGTIEHNQRLSEDRANAVADELAKNGIDPHRIRARGFGAGALAVPTVRGIREPRNRRVEIVLDSGGEPTKIAQ